MKEGRTQSAYVNNGVTSTGRATRNYALSSGAMHSERAGGLYDPSAEHDACGVGFLADMKGPPSRRIVESAVEVLERLLHRGASGADGLTGDGSGLLLPLPDKLFRAEFSSRNVSVPEPGRYAVGVFFLPDGRAGEKCMALIREIVDGGGFHFLGWREVPVDPSVLGEKSRRDMPRITQCMIEARSTGAVLERSLYLLRRRIEHRAEGMQGTDGCFYIPSLSSRTIVYKGLMMGGQLAAFYPDLKDANFTARAAVVHQRYSTNTFPSWKLAQPFRYLAHNGEINTLRGNINQMHAREGMLASGPFGRDIKELLPVIEHGGSDSAALDNALELLANGGRDLPHAMMMLVPQAWGEKYPVGPDLRGFFEYHAGLMEPWDGPAALAFTDGKTVGALLDRNGLRPARYTVAEDGFIVLASETGVLDIAPSKVARKGALGPGQMILVDLERKRLLEDTEIKMSYAHRKPYRRWVEENKISLHGLFNDIAPVRTSSSDLRQRQARFGYTREDLNLILEPMASLGHEPAGSMGADIPPAVLSEKPQLLYCYFKQLFAQVTNPPIDPIREELVMSLMTFMGNAGNILSDEPGHARLIKLPQPVLSNEDLDRVKALNLKRFSSTTLQMAFRPDAGPYGFEEALELLCETAVSCALSRGSLIVLSDRGLPGYLAPVPALLAVSAVNRRLIEKGLRTTTSIIVESGEPREVHHVAMLLGYGATAVNPYLAFETVADMAESRMLTADIDVTTALENYVQALRRGLLKIMSRMGISTLRSYRGAQVFEALGLGRAVIDRYFKGTVSRLGGIGLEEIYEESAARHRAAFSGSKDMPGILPAGGVYRYRKDGERHLWRPESITALRLAARRGDRKQYRKYARLINDQSEKQYTLRGLLDFVERTPVDSSEVEDRREIMKRFVTSAMSFGSLSRPAHQALAIAMNRIGAASNSGEGGEEPDRYRPRPDGDSACSAVKQVASGRFGVNVEYLASAREIQIKISQGAKPGEGGQLPGHKVNEEIAATRHSTPGVTLISPPPHHDIYSIEDIKQLIFDLKNANPEARVSVKLVAEAGVGTVAAGVAKGHADMILISGGDGGTGAAPLSSMRHTGVPWELGLAETQQTLVLNGLRDRVRLQVDGQMKTGRDVVVAALLGAEEFGFATAPLVCLGCVMMRRCNENTCPVGIATQNPELCSRFEGRPEHVINFFTMVADEVRELMARLGFRKFDDMIGQTSVLKQNNKVRFAKAGKIDLSALLEPPGAPNAVLRCTRRAEDELENVLDRKLLALASPALENGDSVEETISICNTDRTVGALLSNRIVLRSGLNGLPEDTIKFTFRGAAGQSFGAFGAKGVTMILEGEANDYLGKGLSGAKIIVKPPAGSGFKPSDNVLCGNVLLYGATEGEVYINGRAGERFAIRNSGVSAVVEGVGDHGCEYMTGGRVAVLGETGVNFAAGMSGGIAYVYDPFGRFDGRCNLDMVDIELLSDNQEKGELRLMLENHLRCTSSARAREILDDWEAAVNLFVKVFPMEYKRVLGLMSRSDESVERQEPEED
ncbi:MAG: glutamate synthase large subunit [Kiritimatiellia bacterium]